jgi:hypothetical protein
MLLVVYNSLRTGGLKARNGVKVSRASSQPLAARGSGRPARRGGVFVGRGVDRPQVPGHVERHQGNSISMALSTYNRYI